MAHALAKLIEIHACSDGSLGGRITCPAALRPAAGQYLLADAHASRRRAALPVTLFPAGPAQRTGELDVAPLPAEWNAGEGLALRGPLGKGFQLPAGARRVALAALDGGLERLLPLVELALARPADVVVYSAEAPLNLPRAVEVMPASLLPEALAWADYLALDAGAFAPARIRACLGLAPGQLCPCPVEVLLRVPMPCGAAAECGACSVRTRRGWKLACKDGPVFSLDELEGE